MIHAATELGTTKIEIVCESLLGEARRTRGEIRREEERRCEQEMTQELETPTTWEIQVIAFHRPTYEFKTTCVGTTVQFL